MVGYREYPPPPTLCFAINNVNLLYGIGALSSENSITVDNIFHICVRFCCFCIRALIAGGGAPEIEVALQLAQYAQTLTSTDAYCVRAFAEALEIIPYTLAENAGLNSISTVTELRNKHSQGEVAAGINVRKVSLLRGDPSYLGRAD